MTARPAAYVAVFSATATRSAGVAKRTPCSSRRVSASRLARVKVARLSATLVSTTVATSRSIPSSRSAAASSRGGVRFVRFPTQVSGSAPTKGRARSFHSVISSRRGRTCLSSRVARVACCRIWMTSRAVGCRPWDAANAATRSSLAVSIALERWEKCSRSACGTPSTSHFGSADRRRCSGRPAPAELGGQLVGEDPVVQLGHADRGPVERLGVEGAPRPVGDGLDPVEDDDVGVQLRVAGAGVPVVERGRDDAADVLLDHAALAHPGGEDLALAVGDDRLEGAAVRARRCGRGWGRRRAPTRRRRTSARRTSGRNRRRSAAASSAGRGGRRPACGGPAGPGRAARR